MRPPAFLLLALVALALTGCGAEEPAAPPAAAGPGLSIEEALASDLEGALLVNGFLHASRDEVRLCAAVLESYPPQCGQPSLLVEGLDLAGQAGLEREGDVAWVEGTTQLLGTVHDGVLHVSENAQA